MTIIKNSYKDVTMFISKIIIKNTDKSQPIKQAINKGFSLIELLIALLIITILSTASVSIYRSFHATNKVHDTAEQLFLVIQQGLYHSALRQQNMYLLPLHHQQGLLQIQEPKDSGKRENLYSGWLDGWSLFLLADNVLNNNWQSQINMDALVSSFHNPLKDDAIEITLLSSLNVQYLAFYPDGSMWPYGRFIVCHQTYPVRYEISFSQWGNLRKQRIDKSCD